jgi:cell division GTPase FtsZ
MKSMSEMGLTQSAEFFRALDKAGFNAEIAQKINPNAHIIWGARVEENLKKSSLRVLVVIAGARFAKSVPKATDSATDINALDIDLVG